MPGIKVTDIAYVRVKAPSLDKAETFLNDFGLVRTKRTDTALYLRGTGSAHHIYIVEKGRAAFLGAAFYAASANDLKKISKVDGASAIENRKEPGGGKVVRLTDPDGFSVEIVHGIKQLKPLKPPITYAMNSSDNYPRKDQMVRFKPGPVGVKRIGHVVINVGDFKATDDFYKSNLGFISSDELYIGDKKNICVAFNRCDRGKKSTDHHTFLAVGLGEPGLGHISFEIENLDALMMAHDYLKTTKYQHAWGIGRHTLGSQIFDYWRDPWGRVHEHWTDGDQLTTDHRTSIVPIEAGVENQWGPAIPSDFL